MSMICEKCEKAVSAAEGKYVYYQNRMVFACKSCAEKLYDEMKCGRQICAAVDDRKNQAEYITNNKDAFNKFLNNTEATLKKIPAFGNLLSDIHLLISLVKSYVDGEYREISYNSIIAVVATLLYVISPIDIIPDVIPGVGYTDDAMAVAFCIKMIHDDLEKYQSWRIQTTGC